MAGPMLTCPFCAGPLPRVRTTSLGEGETGGYAWSAAYRCACGAAMEWMRHEKIGHARESWRALPGSAPRRPWSQGGGPRWNCPTCGGALAAAMPLDHHAECTPRLSGVAAVLATEVELACDTCGARFHRSTSVRSGAEGAETRSETWNALTSRSTQTEWTEIAPPARRPPR